jgi:hypothetical protein
MKQLSASYKNQLLTIYALLGKEETALCGHCKTTLLKDYKLT